MLVLGAPRHGAAPALAPVPHRSADGAPAARLAGVDGDTVLVGTFDGVSGTFETEATTQTASDASWTATGDLNGDGLPDVAVATSNGIELFYGVAAGPAD